MSKRANDSSDEANKKLRVKGEGKKDDINVIDSALLSHQTNYQDGSGSNDVNHNDDSTNKQIEDLAKLRNSDISGYTDYNQLLKNQRVQAQQQAQQAQQQAHAHALQAHVEQSQQQAQQQGSLAGHVVGNSRPAPGTDDWHRIRRDNHKEVERRRRENINAGIKDLSNLLPTPETNKAQILQRAVEYIKRLKENETNNIEKWTLEKLLTDQAVAELSASNEKLKSELEKTYRELEHYKKIAKESKK